MGHQRLRYEVARGTVCLLDDTTPV